MLAPISWIISVVIYNYVALQLFHLALGLGILAMNAILSGETPFGNDQTIRNMPMECRSCWLVSNQILG
jgi:hypothetical protein